MVRSRFVDCIQYSRWRRRCGRCATRNTPESFSLFFLQALCSPMLPWFAKTDHWRELVRADNRLAISGSSTLPVSTGGFARSQSGISPIILCGATCRKRVLALGRGACEIPWTTHFPKSVATPPFIRINFLTSNTQHTVKLVCRYGLWHQHEATRSWRPIRTVGLFG